MGVSVSPLLFNIFMDGVVAQVKLRLGSNILEGLRTRDNGIIGGGSVTVYSM